MFLFQKTEDLKVFIKEYRKQHTNAKIGFVPTMGALHEGHLSLMQSSKAENDLTVCSIFVNPTQFNNAEDLKKYPRTLKKDMTLLEQEEAVDVVYAPEVEEMYPEGMTSHISFDLGFLETVLEGEFRPGHFQGVVQVVRKLLQKVEPDRLYMGQKDFQQCMVIQRLIDVEKLSVNLIICPIKREPDGLAMSSRNQLLTPVQRTRSTLLYQCLVSVHTQKGVKPFAQVKKENTQLLKAKGVKVEYLVLADADTLELLPDYDLQRKMIVLIAAYVGPVRLIDNLVLV